MGIALKVIWRKGDRIDEIEEDFKVVIRKDSGEQY